MTTTTTTAQTARPRTRTLPSGRVKPWNEYDPSGNDLIHHISVTAEVGLMESIVHGKKVRSWCGAEWLMRPTNIVDAEPSSAPETDEYLDWCPVCEAMYRSGHPGTGKGDAQ